MASLKYDAIFLKKFAELVQEKDKLANEAEAQACQDMEMAQKGMLEASQANSRLGKELNATKTLNTELQEIVRRLISEVREA